MNECIIEKEITKILRQTGPIRTNQLVRKIKENPSNESDFSDPTIYRRIRDLKKQKKILNLGFSDYKKYGINDPDKRGRYLILQEFDERRQHVDEILKLLKNGDSSDAITVFDELERYTPRYHLNSNQLDEIVPVLVEDMEVVRKAIRLLHNHVTSFRIVPGNKKIFLDNIKKILKKMERNYAENLSARQECLELLGMWNDPYVVEQLKTDASDLERLKKVKLYYESPYLARIIEKERTSLFNFVRILRKPQSDPVITKNNQAIAEIISHIQSHATHIAMYPRPDSERYNFNSQIE
jgi:hypothetical protein